MTFFIPFTRSSGFGMSPHPHSRAIQYLILFSFLLTTTLISTNIANAADHWGDIKEELFGLQPISESAHGLVMHTPGQAPDAAIVPVQIRLSPKIARTIEALTLIIDRNPAPVAAEFQFMDAYRNSPNIGERTIATRIRVDNFSFVRVVAKLSDGRLLMTKQFVYGAGGCSSPSSKDPDAALASMGQIKIKKKRNENLGANWQEVRIMVRHPNYTGMQMDTTTGNYTPAHFVEDISIRSDERLLFQTTAGISLSENPMIRFTYGTRKQGNISLVAKDSQGKIFRGALAKDGNGS